MLTFNPKERATA